MNDERDEYLDRCHADELINAALEDDFIGVSDEIECSSGVFCITCGYMTDVTIKGECVVCSTKQREL